jgi:hypothetical protein
MPSETTPSETAVGDDNVIQRKSSGAFDDILDTEPADPRCVAHDARRQSRLFHPHLSTENTPTPLFECGCGDCPDHYDPLADEPDGPFADLEDRTDLAGEECSRPIPVTVERGAEIAYRYKMSEIQNEEFTARLDYVRGTHTQALQSERGLLGDWGIQNTTTVLCSFRLPPVEHVEPFEDVPDGVDGGTTVGDDNGILSKSSSQQNNHQQTTTETPPTVETEGPKWWAKVDDRGRRWLPPVQLDAELRQRWDPIRNALTHHLGEFDTEYLWLVGTTDSANTPHLHVLVWIHDPDDEVTVDHFRPVVDKFVTDDNRAKPEHHMIEQGESDAAVIEHAPAVYDHGEAAKDDEDAVGPNTTGLAYLLNQRPEWCLKRLEDGETARHEERIALEGVATSWASPFDWIGSSHGITLS